MIFLDTCHRYHHTHNKNLQIRIGYQEGWIDIFTIYIIFTSDSGNSMKFVNDAYIPCIPLAIRFFHASNHCQNSCDSSGCIKPSFEDHLIPKNMVEAAIP